MFTWIPIHKEAVRKLLDLEQPQRALLAVLREMEEKQLKVISLTDRDGTTSIPLAEIDPLTFLASFNRGLRDDARKNNWRFLKERWGLAAAVPDDFSGIPIVNNMSSWFVSYADTRGTHDVGQLWELVRQAATGTVEQIDKQLFEQCRHIRGTKISKLTIGLFWVNPEQFLPCDRKTRGYAQHKGVFVEPNDYTSYAEWTRAMFAAGTDSGPQISHDAHVWASTRGLAGEGDVPDDEPATARRYWVYAPGKRATHWQEFHDQSVIAVDWEGTADLRSYRDKAAIREALQEINHSTSSKANDTLACWQFVHGMRPGDVVFVKQGMHLIVGYGIVLGDYEYDSARDAFKHRRAMRWLKRGEWQLDDERLPVKTLTDITRYPDLVERLGKLVAFEREAPAEPATSSSATASTRGVSHWWLNANPQVWSFEDMPVGGTQWYTSHNEKGNKRQKYKYFADVRPGDLVIGYVTSPQREIVGICRITKGLHQGEHGEQIELEKIERLGKPVLYEALKGIPELEAAEPLVNHQGSLFKLREEEYEAIRSLIDDANPARTREPKRYTKHMAMDGLFLTETQFDDALEAMREKKNIVLQGPPGVGKTFVARRLARALIGSDDPQRIEMIQFHQSYSYEDFVEGFRPTAKGTFDLRYGVFHQFCRRAQRDEAKNLAYVFIIDEINRGNLSKILGELMMLVEPDKRGSEFAIPLAYASDSSDTFYIPENVYLIGTMNTADRSLAMVDYALRRRFRFLALRPEFTNGAFATHLANHGVDRDLATRIVTRMQALNEVICADTKNLGPGYEIGHSYFCLRNGDRADEQWYRRIVSQEIVPLIQEYWFDDERKVDEQRKALLA
ncbi:MAG: AAA family ATPase [Vicinamibacterales bacterium]